MGHIFIPAEPLQRELTDYLQRTKRTHFSLASEAGLNPRAIWVLCNGQYSTVQLDIADRLCLAMQIPLTRVDVQVAGAEPGDRRGWCRSCRDYVMLDEDRRCGWCDGKVLEGHKRGKPLGTHLQCIDEATLADAYRIYRDEGLPTRAVAARIIDRTKYASVAACTQSMIDAWKARGWKLRSRAESNRLRGERNRALRAQLNPPRACQGTSAKGAPCRLRPMNGSDYCYAHDPAASQQRNANAARMRSRIDRRTWGDIRGDVNDAITRHGRPALQRAAGLDPSVMGRMLRYPPEQSIMRTTVERLQGAIRELDQ